MLYLSQHLSQGLFLTDTYALAQAIFFPQISIVSNFSDSCRKRAQQNSGKVVVKMEASQLRRTSGVKIPLQSENSKTLIQMRQRYRHEHVSDVYNTSTANPAEWGGHIRTSTHALHTRERSSKAEVVNSACTGNLFYMQCTLCYWIQSSLSLCYTTLQVYYHNWNPTEVRDTCS